MLSEPKITAFIPSTKPEKAKQFYKNTLGLKLVSEDQYGLEFSGKGAALRVALVTEFKPHLFTVLGFKIDDIVAQAKSLIDKGVVFERYEHFDQDALGIWTSPSMAEVAWFKDPDGNLLSITEYPS